MRKIIDNGICTSCMACANACPVSCIELVVDEEGFFYPQKEDTCIECGICEKICPRINPLKNEMVKQIVYAGVTKKHKLWKQSTSGGAFQEICRVWDDGDTIFCGAEWNGLQVRHSCVKSLDEIIRFSKSKYIASQIGEVYKEIKYALDCGKKAVFCGTPCQVAGLKSFLKVDHTNLLTIDLICHGVGSPKVFNECINQLEKQFGKKIVEFGFREKFNVHYQDHIERVKFADDQVVYLEEDPYIQLFKSQKCLRNSCGKNCIYRTTLRQGDITIGDFKHLIDVFPELAGDNRNFSTIVFNSSKGNNLIDKINDAMDLYKCDISCIEKYNPLFSKHSWFSMERNAFFSDFIENPSKAVLKWTVSAKVFRKPIKRTLLSLLPKCIRSSIRKKRLK